MRINADQPFDTAIRASLVLSRCSQPDVFAGLVRPGIDILDVTRALRQQQPVQVRRSLDHIPELVSPRIEICARFEDIGHGGAEHARPCADTRRLSIPSQRFTPMVLAEKASGSVTTPETQADSPSPSLRVAVRACRRQLYATPPWVERMVRPFDSGVPGHLRVGHQCTDPQTDFYLRCSAGSGGWMSNCACRSSIPPIRQTLTAAYSTTKAQAMPGPLRRPTYEDLAGDARGV